MKKRVAALTMAVVMAVSAAGCSGGAKESGSQTETKEASAQSDKDSVKLLRLLFRSKQAEAQI